MSQGHVESGETINLNTLKDGMSKDSTFALVKTDDMEVIRMVLPRGKDIERHSIEGEISVHCLKGDVLFQIGKKARKLSEDDWIYLRKNQPHALYAQTDAVLLLTILFTSNSE